MKKSKKIIVPAFALSILTLAGTVGIENTYAHGFGGDESLSQALVEKFSLNEDEVKTFFEERREARQAEMAAQREEALNQLVSEGKLTEDQKNALTSKFEENRAEREANRENFKEMTREERKAERDAHKEEMDQWFEDNGIDKSVLDGLRGGKRGGHGGPGLGK